MKWLVKGLVGLGRIMYAVIKTGGKQYKVSEGDVLRVEKLSGDAGEMVSFDQVLMVGDDKSSTVGKPYVKGAEVQATVLEQTRGDKIIVFKMMFFLPDANQNGRKNCNSIKW